MPFAMIGFSLAIYLHPNLFSFKLLFFVLLAMIFARNSAMAFNRYLDRKIDSLNPRTIKREIPAGIIKPKTALWFVIINVFLFIVTSWFINPLCFYLSPVAICVILGYSYCKRFTSLSHIVLGLSLAIAPTGAYIAVSGQFDLRSIIISAIVLFWVSGFDILYSLQDIDFDQKQNLKSVPARFGIHQSLIISAMLHLVCALLVITVGWYIGMGLIYWLGAIIFIALLVYQHIVVKTNDLTRINFAFMNLNGFASIIYSAFFVADLFIKF